MEILFVPLNEVHIFSVILVFRHCREEESCVSDFFFTTWQHSSSGDAREEQCLCFSLHWKLKQKMSEHKKLLGTFFTFIHSWREDILPTSGLLKDCCSFLLNLCCFQAHLSGIVSWTLGVFSYFWSIWHSLVQTSILPQSCPLLSFFLEPVLHKYIIWAV